VRGTHLEAARPEFDLTGRVVLITGAAGQIGDEVADACAAYGASVVVTDVQAEAVLAARARELSGRYQPDRPALGMRLDVSSDDSVDAALQAVDDRFGRIDVLINNAAIDAKFDGGEAAINPSRFENYPLELWERSVQVNMTGLLRVTQAALKRMLIQGRGNIINVASSYGVVSPNQQLYRFDDTSPQTYKPIDYVGTKSAIPNITRYLATLYARDGIRCNCIVPHGIDNEHGDPFRRNFARLSPIGRMCHVSELRGPFVFLASEASSYMTGATLVVDGGWTAW